MAYKLHCDLCDAVIPEERPGVYLVPSQDYGRKDWKYDNPRIGCMDCVAAFLPGPVQP